MTIKKLLVFLLLIFFLVFCFFHKTYATDITNNSDEILESQMEALNLSSFIKESEEYTKEVFPNINLQDFLYSSLSRKY